MSQWVRLDVGLSEHPKFIGIPAVGKYLFIEILCTIKKMGVKGELSASFFDAEYWSIKLGEPINHLKQWWDVLIERGIILQTESGGLTVHNWQKYQEDPTSTDRVARFRDKQQMKRCETLQGVTGRYVTDETPTGQDSTGPDNTVQDKEKPPHTPRKRGRVVEYGQDFLAFWGAYPRRIGKKAAAKAWTAATDRPPLADILAAIEAQKGGDAWTRDGGAYIPHPATWLNQGRWADEVTAPRNTETQRQREEREKREEEEAFHKRMSARLSAAKATTPEVDF